MNLLHYKSITEVSVLIRSGKLSPVQLVESCLQIIDKLNEKLNTFITITREAAMQQAKIAEQEIKNGKWRGPLHGIPVGIKDFFDTAGVRTTAAFVHFKDRIPAKDAAVVEKLKEAGAIIIGKTNMHELGMGTTGTVSYFGAVHNPWNRDYVAGGSSGGSAAAVATGMCYATIDTDAIGSCRLPAACCGVTGFKGSYGLISCKGILEGEKADDAIIKLAHAAITTRSAEDALLVLQAVGESGMSNVVDIKIGLPSVKKYKIGLATNYVASKAINEIFLNGIEMFKKSGHTLHPIEIPFSAATFNISTIDKDRVSITKSLFTEIDAILLPTTTAATPSILEAEKAGPQAISPDNTFFCNYFGLPVVSIPMGFVNGLPVGFQIVGPSGGEESVLSLASQFQKNNVLVPTHP